MTNTFMRTIRELSDVELDVWESRMRTELSKIRTVGKSGGHVRYNANFRNLRRNIARILTVRNERRETD